MLRASSALVGISLGGTMARSGFWLTPPTRLTLIISVVLMILAVLVHYAHVSIPVVSAHLFETLLIGYLVLLAGNLFRGL